VNNFFTLPKSKTDVSVLLTKALGMRFEFLKSSLKKWDDFLWRNESRPLCLSSSSSLYISFIHKIKIWNFGVKIETWEGKNWGFIFCN
jgi:hypothetical protein